MSGTISQNYMSGNIKTKKVTHNVKETESQEYLQKLKILEGIRKKKLEALEKLAQMNKEKVTRPREDRTQEKTPKKLRDQESILVKDEVKTASKKTQYQKDDYQRLSTAFDEGYKHHEKKVRETNRQAAIIKAKQNKLKKNAQIKTVDCSSDSDSQGSGNESSRGNQKYIDLLKNSKKNMREEKFEKKHQKNNRKRTESSDSSISKSDNDQTSSSDQEEDFEEFTSLKREKEKNLKRRKRKSLSRDKQNPVNPQTGLPKDPFMPYEARMAGGMYQHVGYQGQLMGSQFMMNPGYNYGLQPIIYQQGQQIGYHPQQLFGQIPVMNQQQMLGSFPQANRTLAVMPQYEDNFLNKNSKKFLEKHKINQTYLELDKKYEDAMQRIQDCCKERRNNEAFEISFSERQPDNYSEKMTGKYKEDKRTSKNLTKKSYSENFYEETSDSQNKFSIREKPQDFERKPVKDENSIAAFDQQFLTGFSKLKKFGMEKEHEESHAQESSSYSASINKDQSGDQFESSQAYEIMQHLNKKSSTPKNSNLTGINKNQRPVFFEEAEKSEDEKLIKAPVAIEIPINSNPTQKGKPLTLSEAFKQSGLGGAHLNLSNQKAKEHRDHSRVTDKHELLKRRLNMGKRSVRREKTEDDSYHGTAAKHSHKALSTNKRHETQASSPILNKSSNGLNRVGEVMYFPANDKPLSVSSKKSALKQIDSNKPVKMPPPELLERLAKGEKKEISKREMYELTQRNYKNLPEIQQKEKEKQKKEEIKNRMDKMKEYNRNLRENLGIVTNANTSLNFSYLEGSLMLFSRRKLLEYPKEKIIPLEYLIGCRLFKKFHLKLF